MVLYEPTTSDTATATAEKKMTSWVDYGWSAPTRFDNAVVRGDLGDFWGTLVSEGLPIAGATIRLVEYNIDTGVSTDIATATTDVNGTVTFSGITLSTTVASYYYRLVFDETDIFFSSSMNFAVKIESRVPVLSLSMPASAVSGSTVTWSGSMVDPKVTTYGIADKSIYLDESPDGVTWTQVAGPVVTDGAGAYSGSYTLPTTPGTYYYRSRFPGGSPGAEHEAATSKPVKVEVKTEVTPWDQLKNWWQALPTWQKALIATSTVIGVSGSVYAITRKKK